jgi:adenylate cyclase
MRPPAPENHPQAEEVWREYMTTGQMPDYVPAPWFERAIFRPLIKLLPKDPRCKVCLYPFKGIGGTLVRTFLGVAPSKMNPQLCNVCERAANHYHGGAEMKVSVLFADVRGSTGLAEHMSPAKFSQLIDHFYQTTTRVLYSKNALVEKLIGDEVTGFFVPGFAGKNYARVAIEAGEEILRAVGYGSSTKPWLPVGVGVHYGIAYVGSVTSEGGAANITVLGDTANVGARLTSLAGAGEMMISEAARQAANLDPGDMEMQKLELKGREDPLDVWKRKV